MRPTIWYSFTTPDGGVPGIHSAPTGRSPLREPCAVRVSNQRHHRIRLALPGGTRPTTPHPQYALFLLLVDVSRETLTLHWTPIPLEIHTLHPRLGVTTSTQPSTSYTVAIRPPGNTPKPRPNELPESMGIPGVPDNHIRLARFHRSVPSHKPAVLRLPPVFHQFCGWQPHPDCRYRDGDGSSLTKHRRTI